MYHYEHCTVTRVVDGDTFDVEFDLGFSTKVHWRCRLKGFNTAETTWRAACPGEKWFGDLTTEFVEDLILDKPVKVTTHKIGIYARYRAEIFHQDPEDPSTFLSLKESLRKAKHHKRDIDCRVCPYGEKCDKIDEVYKQRKLRWRGTPDPTTSSSQ